MSKKTKAIPFNHLFFSKSEDFLTLYLTEQRNHSPATVKAYKQSLTDFRKYTLDVKNISIIKFKFTDCTYEYVLEYSQYMQNTLHYKPTTVNSKLAAIKTYLSYVAACNIEATQTYLAVEKVPYLRVPKLHRPVIEEASMAALLEAPSVKQTKFSLRDQTFLIILFDTAVRIGELVQMNLCDCNLNTVNPYILVHGKGNKERTVGLSNDTLAFLKKYITEYHSESADRNVPLFYTKIKGTTHHMCERNGERIVKKYADMIRQSGMTLPETVYPHMFRRTRATGLYQDNVDLEMIARLLGHAQLETSKIYAVASVEQLRAAMEHGSNATSVNSEEEPLWVGNEDELAKKFGLR